ncbi:uncharacterized protein LOC132730265 [Ruditapes philippinarum]|uniref:uncharacterized protein LOC132730265 n=1 Tax=Ruditapes philippinarum TaxID=129788 RepID=UPI00295B740F|nr:uncharacterized protein LOC132730265 [Ruditapes philippinarum]
MYLRPSNIRYSQDSINNVFDKRCNHSYKPIGETLDAICEGRCSVNDIPTISVVLCNGNWVTADNRRLWVFRQLERLGKCDKVLVQKGYYIPDSKMTSENDGLTVCVRGSPGGYWHQKSNAPKRPINSPKNSNNRGIYDFNSSSAGTQNVISKIPSNTGHGSQNRSTSSIKKVVSNTTLTPGHGYQIRPASISRNSEYRQHQEGFGNIESNSGRQYNRHNESRHALLSDELVYRDSYDSEKQDDCCCIII